MIANVPVRVMVPMTDVTAVATVAATVHAAAVATAAVHSAATVTAAAMAAGAGRSRR